MKKNKIKRGTILIILGVIMIIGAASLAIYNHFKEESVGKTSEDALVQLTQIIEKGVLKNPTEETDDLAEGLETGQKTPEQTKPAASSSADESKTPAKETEKASEAPTTIEESTVHDPNNMPYSIVDNHYYIGILAMPTVGVTLPVQWGWSDELMDISPCRYSGNIEENNLILLAHNYSTHFGVLFNLKVGDTLTFTDVNNKVYTYQVSYTESFHRNQIAHIYEGEWDLTLFTCVPRTYNRLAVRCKLIS